MKKFENVKNTFEVPCLVVANKVDVAEKEKLKMIKDRFEKVYELSLVKKELSRPDSFFLKKELGDLTNLMQDLAQSIAPQATAQKGVRIST